MTRNFEFLKDNLIDLDEGFIFEEEPIEDSHVRVSGAEQTTDIIEKDFVEELRNPSNTKLVFNNKSTLLGDNIDLFVESSKIDNNLVDLIYQLAGSSPETFSNVSFRLIVFDDTNIDLVENLNFEKLDREYEQLFLPKTNALRETFILKGKEIVVEDFKVKDPSAKRQTKLIVKKADRNLIVYLVVYNPSEENPILIFKLDLLKDNQFSKTERIYDLRHSKKTTSEPKITPKIDVEQLEKDKSLYVFSKLHASTDEKKNFRFLFGVNIGAHMESRVAFPELLEDDILNDAITDVYIMRARVERHHKTDRESYKTIAVQQLNDLFLDDAEGFVYFTGIDDTVNYESTYKYTVNITTFDPTIKKAKKMAQDIRDIQTKMLDSTDEVLRFELKKLYIFLLDIFDNVLPSEYRFLESIIDPNIKIGILKENIEMLSHELYELLNWFDSKIDLFQSAARKYREAGVTSDVSKLDVDGPIVADGYGFMENEYIVNFWQPINKLEIDGLQSKETINLKVIGASAVKTTYTQEPKIAANLKMENREIPLIRNFSETKKKSKLQKVGGIDIKTKTEQAQKIDVQKKDSTFLVEEDFFVEDIFLEYLSGYAVDFLGEFESITSEKWLRLNTQVIDEFPVGTMLLTRLALADNYENKYFLVEK